MIILTSLDPFPSSLKLGVSRSVHIWLRLGKRFALLWQSFSRLWIASILPTRSRLTVIASCATIYFCSRFIIFLQCSRRLLYYDSESEAWTNSGNGSIYLNLSCMHFLQTQAPPDTDSDGNFNIKICYAHISHKPLRAGAGFSVELPRSLRYLSIQPTPVPTC